MSKLFYSVEETAQKLGKSEDDVRQMASSGALEEFREGDELVFKAEQVDLLAGGDDDEDLSLDLDGGLDLSDSAGASGITLADSEIDLGESALDLMGAGEAEGSAIPVGDDAPEAPIANEASGGDGGSVFDLAESDLDLTLADSAAASGGVDLGADPDGGESPMEQTGVSIFADDGDEADPSAATFVADGAGAPEIDLGADQLDAVGSGSGLLDLTQEGDDTSLGVDLLDDAYGGDATSMGAPAQPAEGAGLFEATEAVGGGELGTAPAMAAPAVAYDGTGSGIVLGLSIGISLAALFAGAATILSSAGVGVSTIIDVVGGQWFIPAAALGGITVFGAVIGMFLMKKG